MNPSLYNPWFQNIVLPDGTETNPSRPEYPLVLWNEVLPYLDLKGKTVLDIGSNGGFMMLEMEKLGATVTAIDSNPLYVNQSNFIKKAFNLNAKVYQRDIEVPLDNKYDIVLMLGIIYHVENPILALKNTIKATKEYLILETAIAAGEESFAKFMDLGPLMYKWVPTLKCMETLISYCGGTIADFSKRNSCERFIYKIKPSS